MSTRCWHAPTPTSSPPKPPADSSTWPTDSVAHVLGTSGDAAFALLVGAALGHVLVVLGRLGAGAGCASGRRFLLGGRFLFRRVRRVQCSAVGLAGLRARLG